MKKLFKNIALLIVLSGAFQNLKPLIVNVINGTNDNSKNYQVRIYTRVTEEAYSTNYDMNAYKYFLDGNQTDELKIKNGKYWVIISIKSHDQYRTDYPSWLELNDTDRIIVDLKRHPAVQVYHKACAENCSSYSGIQILCGLGLNLNS